MPGIGANRIFAGIGADPLWRQFQAFRSVDDFHCTVGNLWGKTHQMQYVTCSGFVEEQTSEILVDSVGNFYKPETCITTTNIL